MSSCAQAVVPNQSSCPQPELIAPLDSSCECLAQGSSRIDEKSACQIRKAFNGAVNTAFTNAIARPSGVVYTPRSCMLASVTKILC